MAPMATRTSWPTKAADSKPDIVVHASGVKKSPSLEQWERYREGISELYSKNILEEVMKIMREKHDFHAT